MTHFVDGACTVGEAFEDDSDQYPFGPPTPTTSRALSNELKHFRRMAEIESDEPTSALWTSLANQVDAYLNGAPLTEVHNLSLFDHGATP